jgi:hypothetical protein
MRGAERVTQRVEMPGAMGVPEMRAEEDDGIVARRKHQEQ